MTAASSDAPPVGPALQLLECLLHSYPRTHDAGVVPHNVLNLANQFFDSRVYGAVLRRGFLRRTR